MLFFTHKDCFGIWWETRCFVWTSMSFVRFYCIFIGHIVVKLFR